MANIDDLLIVIDASTEALRTELNRANSEVSRFAANTNRNLNDVNTKFDSLTRTIGGARTIIAGFFAGVSIQGALQLGRAALEYGDNLERLAEQANLGVEELQSLRQVFRKLEVDGESFEKILDKLVVAMGDVTNGAETSATKALDRLGVSADILSGKIATTDQLMLAIAKAFEGIPDPAQRAAVAADLVGSKLGADLAAALGIGTKALQDMILAAKEGGSVLSEELVAELAAANEEIDRFKEYAGAKFAIGIGSIIRNVREKMPELRRALETGASPTTMGFMTLVSAFTPADGPPKNVMKGAIPEAGYDPKTGTFTGLEAKVRPRKVETEGEQREREKREAEAKSKAEQAAEEAARKAKQRADQEAREAARRWDETIDRAMRADREEKSRLEEIASKRRSLADLAVQGQIDVLRAQAAGTEDLEARALLEAEIVRRSIDAQIAEYQRLAKETPEIAAEAASVISQLELRKGIEVAAALAEPQRRRLADLRSFAEQVAAVGTSALEDFVIEGGDVDDAIKALIVDFGRLAVRLIALKPIADGVAQAIAGIGAGGGGGGFLGFLSSIGGSIAGVLGARGKTVSSAGTSAPIRGIDGLPGRASGGPVTAGRAYMVGEEGPEPFIPHTNGTILPADFVQRMTGSGVNLTINAPGATAETVSMIRRELLNAAPALISAAQTATMRAASRPSLPGRS